MVTIARASSQAAAFCRRSAETLQAPGAVASMIEMAAALLLLEAFLWGRTHVPAAPIVFGVPLLALVLNSHRRSHEGWREIGFDADTALGALVWFLPVFAFAVTAIGIAGAYTNGARGAVTSLAAAQFLLSGIAQQYLLLGFFYRRSQELWPPGIAAGIAALVFALLHAPNTFLITVTLFAGFVSCTIYRKAPNVVVAGLVHGSIACLLFVGLPSQLTGSMRVAIEYVQRS